MRLDDAVQATYYCYAFVAAVVIVAAGVMWTSASADTWQPHDVQAAVSTTENVQTMALRQPNQRVNPRRSIGGGNIGLVGDVAVVAPQSPATGDSVDLGASTQSKQTSIYVVRSGDTIGEIAELFDVSVNTIAWANDISTNESLSQGDTLIILPTSGVRHEVQEGDTLEGIADRYNGDIKKIREFNEITDGELSVGAVIDVPGGEMPEDNTDGAVNESPQKPSRVANNTTKHQGAFIHPVPDSVITQKTHGYNAVDMAAAHGSSVLASASGKVVKSVGAGWNGGYGKFLVIEHDNGTQTLYSHLSSVIVSQGQRIVQGQIVGYVGNSGRSTGPHLHFEVRGTKNPFASCGLRSRCGS